MIITRGFGFSGGVVVVYIIGEPIVGIIIDNDIIIGRLVSLDI